MTLFDGRTDFGEAPTSAMVLLSNSIFRIVASVFLKAMAAAVVEKCDSGPVRNSDPERCNRVRSSDFMDG